VTPTPDETREHVASRRALLDVEEATADLLVQSADDLGRSSDAAAEELRRRLDQIYLAARKAARKQSRARLEAELGVTMREALRYGVRPLGPLPLLPRPIKSDATKASEWSSLVAEQFRKRAEASGVRTAIGATTRRLQTSAQAVVADAWADERERVLRAAAREHEGADVLPAIVRQWDARLDACTVCRRLDGTVRPVGFDFPGGDVPGKVHAHCRCDGILIFAPIYLGRGQAA
jgi:hypothetical protein